MYLHVLLTVAHVDVANNERDISGDVDVSPHGPLDGADAEPLEGVGDVEVRGVGVHRLDKYGVVPSIGVVDKSVDSVGVNLREGLKSNFRTRNFHLQ